MMFVSFFSFSVHFLSFFFFFLCLSVSHSLSVHLSLCLSVSVNVSLCLCGSLIYVCLCLCLCVSQAKSLSVSRRWPGSWAVQTFCALCFSSCLFSPIVKPFTEVSDIYFQKNHSLLKVFNSQTHFVAKQCTVQFGFVLSCCSPLWS